MAQVKLEDIITYFKNFKVLYVEDNAQNRESVLSIFEDLFGDVVVGVDGVDGLNLYKKYLEDTNDYFDMVISDIHMPNLDGIGMIEAIYNINQNQRIIIISAYENKEYLIPLINLGVNGFIQKPISLNAILDVLNPIYQEFKNFSVELMDGYIFKSNLLLKDNNKIDLTKSEIKLLTLFIKNNNKYFNLEQIYNYIFFDELFKEFTADSIRGIIKRLKAKLPDNLIINNRTLGYKIDIS